MEIVAAASSPDPGSGSSRRVLEEVSRCMALAEKLVTMLLQPAAHTHLIRPIHLIRSTHHTLILQLSPVRHAKEL
ncbi:unnamed protein product [Linum trigynum]|uniref:Uncharacterized protein n=1 Tax=Linum trigynum TaxID=586398 RepID=A0AAV2F9R2_9ROSI